MNISQFNGIYFVGIKNPASKIDIHIRSPSYHFLLQHYYKDQIRHFLLIR